MATLAQCQEVVRVSTDRVAVAKVCRGEDDAALEELGVLVVDLQTAAHQRIGLVQAALAGAFATVEGARGADEERDAFPVGGIERSEHRHQAITT